MKDLLTELRALLAAQKPAAPALRDLAGRLHAEPGCRWLAWAVGAYGWALAGFGGGKGLEMDRDAAHYRTRVETELEMTA